MTTQQTSTGPFSPLRLSTGAVHPFFYIYGTAFKEDRTGELKALALKKGFRGVDSAKHLSAYEEPSVGIAIEEALKSGVKRESLFEENEYDADIREYLDKTGIAYQAFSLLKANQEIRSSELVARVAGRFHTEREIAFYMLVLGLGKVSIVNGTMSEAQELDLVRIAELLGDQQAVSDLTECLAEFKQLLRIK
ncbi:NADP-dependent oxidoreductase domain protein [Metarhizium guizhouense ARSEF 977]|uniref:NADP-dependent oxidoreductase domain protein n=1 Tax=Metarhizium guizhouense (strain ARSEF 977) TaxID=1276136 RepID=A0A0B4GR12_METGA|nr:NADP-dependent oxidoreductase domain protein [Metarhizium guizhouense ARSEF 977]